jgi:hypothetical protein
MRRTHEATRGVRRDEPHETDQTSDGNGARRERHRPNEDEALRRRDIDA